MHHAPVRGFACKLDGGPLKRCCALKTYLVGFGRHLFRVRAIGWSGLKGPVATAPFRVCHPTPYPNCVRHLPRCVSCGRGQHIRGNDKFDSTSSASPGPV
jgi:hypothetical protein